VKVLTALFGPTDAIDRALALREAGATGVFTFEGPHDVFAPLTLASTIGGLDLMTNVAIAFPRMPLGALRASASSRIALTTAARLPRTPLPSLLNFSATRCT
jgi:2-methylisocitrate lyase-like PEP mutase family enzyme